MLLFVLLKRKKKGRQQRTHWALCFLEMGTNRLNLFTPKFTGEFLFFLSLPLFETVYATGVLDKSNVLSLSPCL